MGTIRTGCKAQLMICTVDGKLYTVKRFVDGHNHKFVCPHDIHMLPAYKQLSDAQEEMIWELGTLNLGPVKGFHIMRKRYGGFENVGAMVDDCKNFRNQIYSYIGEYDADMVINRLTDKKQYLVDYSFEYYVDDDRRLTGLFWDDGLCKRNFMEFRDVISFDATFKTNRLGVEYIACYTSFGRQPKVVVTDQDPAMKQAIEEVFSTSRHRLCMWHIMKKVADKVGHKLCNNDEFKRRMCDIVWIDSIDPEEFVRQWKLVMIEYGLTQNTWIDDMFAMRSMWIPAFYRHEPMSGLMRTTSRSEKFMNHFDGAMDVQRFNHRKNDHISRYTEPNDWSQTTLEKDAAKIYTRSIFFDQQIEIYGTITECLPMDTKIEGPRIRIALKDFKAHGDGLLEMFGVKEIPNKYVMKRWTKDVVPNELNATFDVKILKGKQQKKMKGVQIEKDPRHKANEVEDDEEEDEFEDYSGSSDDGTAEEEQWEEVSDEED
ncbi:protein FAR1-RELATED SEQUENCE 5-like [Helianthus annuus]|uniref:protein FAR1-RELATED SEQUENCE 5-like n=1 Tax=Helianthus annuus TaxID=4232 RepID=UPI0016531F8A|nr:protein FAR1-RELATED SEQUENCE 5-like [Helianthus annuus]